MKQTSMTYGELPTREQYDDAWSALESAGELRHGLFTFGNDPRLGDVSLSRDELWKEICRAHKEYMGLLEDDTDQDPEEVGSWLSSVLSCLNFEWV